MEAALNSNKFGGPPPPSYQSEVDLQNNLVIPQNNNQAVQDKSKCAVYIRNVCKSYGGNSIPVLNNFCMNLQKGTIYGLLGSSGCGKTTMLSCIVGLDTWERGELLVFGKKPGSKGSEMPGRRLGYMPQELALYKHLTIREIIQFYGQLYNMANGEISEMYDFLKTLLELPLNSTLIGDLSGGQKRRASLALAMIHSPELLVLDEPTAGVDPLLRKNIWDHLYKLVKTTGTTVLITTHYIEEARLSNTIGVMRKGRLLVEDSPRSILKNYNCDLLEDAVVHLCRADESNLKILAATPPSTTNSSAKKLTFKSPASWSFNLSSLTRIIEGTENDDNDNLVPTNGKFLGFDGDVIHGNHRASRPRGLEHRSSYSYCCEDKSRGSFDVLKNYALFRAYRRIVGLTKVILLTMTRNPVYLGLILFLPTVQGVLSLLAVGTIPVGLALGVVNNELSNWTRECDLPENSGEECHLSMLSCQYLNQLRTSDLVQLEAYETEEEARSQVDLGNLFGYLTFADNFSSHSVERAAAKFFASNESIDGSQIHVHLDYSEYIQVSLVLKHLLFSYMEFLTKVTKSCDMEGEMMGIPLNFRPPVYGSYDDEFIGYVIPGIVMLSLFGIGVGITGLTHVADRTQGTLTRARSAGLSATDIISSYLISQTLVTVIQLVIWNSLLYFVFHFSILGSPWLWILFSLLIETLGVFIGIFFGQIFQNEMQVLLILIFLFTIFVWFGCIFIPVERMDTVWQYVANAIPTFWPTGAARSVVIRGVGITHGTVWPAFVSLGVWTLVMTFVVLISFRLIRK